MTDRLRIVSAQLNPVVGDIEGAVAAATDAARRAQALEADLVVFGELSLIGYPPEDLVLKPAAVADCRRAVERLAAGQGREGWPALLVGAPWLEAGRLHNAVILIDGGAVRAVRFKRELPNYEVFDEKRVFVPGPLPEPVVIRGVPVGVPVCEDMWFPDVAAHLKALGAELLIVPNGSPYRRPALARRLEEARARVAESGLPLVYVNQCGGQDELVFDGASFALAADGAQVQGLIRFAEALSASDWVRTPAGWTCVHGEITPWPEGEAADYAAMTLALRDYVTKNRFPGVLLGLSGGIDSALSAAVAVDALGPARVRCVMMPSRYTSGESLDDAAECAARLGVTCETIPIEPAVEAFAAMLAPAFAGREPDVAEENIQSRARAVTLMALSNKFGHMVLTTGNKSEMAVGYATLYGDMCGGYNVLKDLWKMEVYGLSAWRNANVTPIGMGPAGAVIPPRILSKAPSAELRANQTDQDSLPPYPDLDDMLRGLVDHEEEIERVVARGHDPQVVLRIQNLLNLAEYKRRQAPPGVKLGVRNFGRDRRYPITNRYRDRID